MSRKIGIDDLKPGMKLARALTARTGIMLLPRGAVLTESQIQTLRAMSVEKVSIVGPPTPQITKEQLLSDLDRRFHKEESKPAMKFVKKIVQEHIESLYESNGSCDTEEQC